MTKTAKKGEVMYTRDQINRFRIACGVSLAVINRENERERESRERNDEPERWRMASEQAREMDARRRAPKRIGEAMALALDGINILRDQGWSLVRIAGLAAATLGASEKSAERALGRLSGGGSIRCRVLRTARERRADNAWAACTEWSAQEASVIRAWWGDETMPVEWTASRAKMVAAIIRDTARNLDLSGICGE